MIVTVRHFGCAEYLAYHGYTQAGEVVFHDITRRPPTVKDIQRRVAEHYGLREAEMKSARLTRDVTLPRQVAMYLACSLTSKSASHIGRLFGDRDHTTVLHARRQIEKLLGSNSDVEASVSYLKAEFAE